jgi:FkbM family methyltransferase
MTAGGIAADVGANYGQMTLALTYGAGTSGTVYAFEPHPHQFKYLEQNARDHSGIIPIQKAVSEDVGRSTLHVPRTWSSDAGVSSLNSSFRRDTQGLEVETTSLDTEFDGINTIDVLKVDVEGHEYKVFLGGINMIYKGYIKNILFEEHNYEKSEAVDILKKNGYTLFSFRKTLGGPELANPRPGEKDYIATLDERDCRQRFERNGWRAFGEN